MNCGKKVRLKPRKISSAVMRAPGHRIGAAEHLGPPEVQRAEERRDRAADHDVVEVRDHEVGVVHVHVDRQHRQHQPGQPAEHEQADERRGEQERRIDRDLAFVERRRPVVDLDAPTARRPPGSGTRRRRRHTSTGRRRTCGGPTPGSRPRRSPARSRRRTSSRRRGLRAAAAISSLTTPSRRQDHDVDGGMAVEPEQVLVEQRIAAELGIEHAEPEQPLGGDQRPA